MSKNSTLDVARNAPGEELLLKVLKEEYFAQLVEATDNDHIVGSSITDIKLANSRLATLSIHKATELPTELRISVFELFEANMKEKYLNSRDGYASEEKQEELFDEESRFIIIQERDGPDLLGFTSFRFDMEDTADDDVQIEVVYCYEVQVGSASRGAGLGRLLMRCLETLARSYSLAKVMLTVFKANTEARTFYKRINYESDVICPSKYDYSEDEEKADYLILSRTIRAKSSRNKKKKKKVAA